MKLRDYIYNVTTYATILSIAGGFLVANASQDYRLIGFCGWVISNFIWVCYFIKTKQTNPAIMFSIYFVTSILGVINNL